MARDWYELDDVDSVETPALVIYPDRVAANVRRMIEIAGRPERLRPHIKTHKMAEMICLQCESGIKQFKCATLGEAELLAGQAVDDVMLAYPLLGPNVARLVDLAVKHPRIRWSALVDNVSALRQLSQAASQAGSKVGVWIDLDVGMGRTGIAPGPAAIELCRTAATLPGIVVRGLHVYDGHLRQHDPQERQTAAELAIAPVLAMRRELEATLGPIELMAGGSPTFAIHAAHADRQCSPGTTVFWDASYSTKFPDLPFDWAAMLVTRVISVPSPRRVCLDLGFKAVAADNPDPRVIFPAMPDARMLIHSEEHLAIDPGENVHLAVGDVVYGVPHHICPTCALYPHVLVSRERHVIDRWTVAARDRRLAL